MKLKFLTAAMLLVALVFTSCKSDKANEAVTTEAEEAAVGSVEADAFKVVTESSTINWTGFKPTGSHTGTIALNSGTLTSDNGSIESGSFEINMKSITVTDLEAGDGKEDLEAHLMGTVEGKKDHFFDVATYPTATFEITGSEALEGGKTQLSGNLTMKGKTQNISFPATITSTNDVITIESDSFTIDRTLWGVNYGSKSIFDNLGDQFINDDMELKIAVKAKK